jgi:type IV pilus assembly protein PilB
MEKRDFVEAICAILEKNGAITHQESNDLKNIFAKSSQTAFDDFLLEEGLVTKEDILKALSSYYNVPAMDPIGYFCDHYLVTKFPKDFLLRNLILPIEVIEDNILVVLANNPYDEELLPIIGNYVSYDIQFLVGIASEIIETVEEFYDKSLTDLPLDDELFLEHEEENEAKRDIEEISEEE